MEPFAHTLLTALALVFVIEGLIYALFPGGVRKMMAFALTMPPERMRLYGLGMAFLGAIFIWFLNR